MKITVVYDNEVKKEGLRAGWGFSALIEDEKQPPLLFDAGADSSTLLHNMKELNIDPQDIGIIVISHAHGDHTGGLPGILGMNEIAELYLPGSFGRAFPSRKVTLVKDPIKIRDNVFSSGELEGVEQSLALKTDRGIFVLTGCAHPAMKSILGAAAKFGKLYGIAGGFHGFSSFSAFSDLSLICPCHCTIYKQEIRDFFKDKALECGAGLVIEL
jgi:7,8-dihydropterin-6-yl-methyl-4-(beta-D-ribofuranosyl)aminobenzene 5'-phosphate synthase